MSQQLLITIGRETGSGGLDIARALSARFQLPLYDKHILDKIAVEHNADPEDLKRYDEIPRFRAFSRTVQGFNNSPHEQVARMQFEYLAQKAAVGESFLVLGRCGEEVLRQYDNLISIFVHANIAFRIRRIMEIDNISKDKALARINRIDRLRKNYHNQYSGGQWGDSRNYDLCIDSGKLGIEKTADILEQYIHARIFSFGK